MWDWKAPPIAIRRIEVPNSGFMRGQPTNCYVIGEDPVVIVDPGSEPGIELIPQKLEEFGSPAVESIFLTHAHPDHAIATPELRRQLNVPVMLHPDNAPIMNEHISWSDVDIEIDLDKSLCIDGLVFDLVLTPGHAPGHVALMERKTRVMLAGDLVSGNGTIGVFPPNGSMIEYMDSLYRTRDLEPSVLLPGHGPVIDDPPALIAHYIERRLGREEQILDLVSDNGASIADILPVLYPDLLPEYSFPAEATILAHLLKLEHDGRVRSPESDPKTGIWLLNPVQSSNSSSG